MEKILERMQLHTAGLCLQDVIERAENAYLSRGKDILQFEKHNVFDYMEEDIKRIRDRAAKDADLVRYCYFLSEVLRTEDSVMLSRLSSPCKEKKDALYDLLPIFALLDHIPAMTQNLRERGVPEDVIQDTCKMFQNQVQDFIDLHGHPGISGYVTWLQLFLQCKIIRVGRLNLEMTTYGDSFEIITNGEKVAAIPNSVSFHKSGRVLGSVGCEEAEDSFVGIFSEKEDAFCGLVTENGLCTSQTMQYNKRTWRRVITKGTPVISVHIPSGGSLSPEICERDLARGKAIIQKCFGNYRHFYCASWLLDPMLGELLNHRGNLCRFAERFLRFPFKSDGTSVFGYVFHQPADTAPALLPEETSLAKAIKAHLCRGGHIYGACGVIVDMEG